MAGTKKKRKKNESKTDEALKKEKRIVNTKIFPTGCQPESWL